MITKIATRFYGQMEHATRVVPDDGAKFWRTVYGAEEALGDLIHDAHDGMFPDDHRYRMIVDALLAISEMDDDHDEDDIHDELAERLDSSVPVYNGQLAAWLASHGGRGAYVDEAVSEMGYPENGIYTALMWGYAAELREVADLVLDSLMEIAEEEGATDGE